MNLDDFYLYDNDKNIIYKWLKTFDKPLYITGTSGIGKTTLINSILKDYNIVYIDYKLIKNINEYIEKSIYEKDISMMFQNKKVYKAILFDNISYKDRNIMSFLKTFVKKLTKTPFIICSNNINNKKIQNISNHCYHIYLKYTYEQYYTICKNLYPDISNDLIINSNYNLNMIKSNIDFYINNYNKNSYIDSYEEDIYILTEDFKKDHSANELFIKYSCDYNTIGLNILDDISNNTKHENLQYLCSIYDNMIIYDNYEKHKIIYNIYNSGYSIIYSIYLSYMIIKKYNIKLSKKIKYNSYTSKSLIYTHLNTITNLSDYNIYFELFNFLIDNNFDNINQIDIYNINKKLFNKYISLYELLYNKIICKNKLKNFYNQIK